MTLQPICVSIIAEVFFWNSCMRAVSPEWGLTR